MTGIRTSIRRYSIAAILALYCLSPAVFGQDSNCTDEQIEQFKELVQEWTGISATGIGEGVTDVLSRFAADVENLDLDLDASDVKLTWNFSPYLSAVAEIGAEAELYAPLAMKLESDEESLARFRDSAKDDDDWSVSLRYHYENRKSRRETKKGLDAKRLPFGNLAVGRAARDDDGDALVRLVVGALNKAGGRLKGASEIDDICDGLAKIAAWSADLDGDDEFREVLERTLGVDPPRLSSPEIEGKLRAGWKVKRTDKDRETLKKNMEASESAPQGYVSAILEELAVAISNTPEFLVEAKYQRRGDLVGADEESFRVKYARPIFGGRSLLDEPGSVLSLVSRSLDQPNAIKRRAKLVVLGEWSDVEDYSLAQGLETALNVAGGEKWKVSLGYTAETGRSLLSRSKRSGNDDSSGRHAADGDFALKRSRFEFFASYEDFGSDIEMAPDDRYLFEANVTVPFQVATQVLDLTLGVVYASESELLQEFDFDSELSAKAGLVFKFGDSRLRDFLGK